MNTTKVEDSVDEKQIIIEVHCYACGHNWIPRTVRTPMVCPRCKRFKWKKEDWEASKARKRKGGKHVNIKKTAHLGPKTEQFLQQKQQKRKET